MQIVHRLVYSAVVLLTLGAAAPTQPTGSPTSAPQPSP